MRQTGEDGGMTLPRGPSLLVGLAAGLLAALWLVTLAPGALSIV